MSAATRSEGWAPFLSRGRADRALEVAREVGRRLADPQRLAYAIESVQKQSSMPEYAAWKPVSLTQGHPGLALTFAQLDACFPRQGWGDAAHRQLELSVEALRAEGAGRSGLFAGLAGLAFTAHSVDAARYVRLVDTLDGLLARRTRRLIARLDSRKRGAAEQDFDVVSGLAGVGAYYLMRCEERMLRQIIDRLIRLVLADDELPGWYTPPELLDRLSASAYPQGNLNCGLAHGLPGPLALLALASAEGLEANRLRQAIEHASAWLVEQIVEDEWGVNWPEAVPIGPGAANRQPARAAWCYGAPGVSRALWLAGGALGDRRLHDLAVAGLEGVYRRPPEVRHVDAPTFCHGLAGLLQITLRMANDSGRPPLRAAAAELAEQLVASLDPDAILGYRDEDPDGRVVDRPGLLQGAAGVALVLLAAASPAAPRWDRMFLLA